MKDNKLEDLRVPLSCPLCKIIMRGKSTFTYMDHGVCVNCFIQFVEGREKRWKDGWRPSNDQLELYLKIVKDA